MKNIKKKVSALVLTTMFAMMQVSAAIDTGLGAGNGGAVINNATGGFVGLETGTNSATLNFNGNSHVNWDTLNVNSGETLNFNAVDGTNGITVLNTVNQGMTNVYGQINANQGISKLIISNPNGVLFDGATFTTAGDAMITAQGAAMDAHGVVTYDPSATRAYTPNGQDYVITVKNSDFKVGGDLNFVAPTMNVVKSAFNVKNGKGDVKFTTTNGQDYFITESNGCGNGCCGDGCGTKKYTETQSMRMEAVQIDGNVYITSDKGIVKTIGGGQINGNLNIQSDGSVALNYVDNGKVLNVTGDVNAKANGPMMYARNTKVDGNLNMTNGGGFLEVGNVQVGKDMNLTTTAESENPHGYKHFTHVIGKTSVGGNATINSQNNIHIGNYEIAVDENGNTIKLYKENGRFYYDGKLLDGEFNVGKNLTATTKEGHIMTTVNVNVGEHLSFDANAADGSVNAEYFDAGVRAGLSEPKAHYGGNILSSPDAVLNAKTYEFKSDGYIGALKGNEKYTTEQVIINTMEAYDYVPKDTSNHDYLKIAGGTITNIETPKDSQVYIGSKGDVVLTGADAGDINITAYRKRIDIQGPNVHAKNINVGPETDYLKVEFEGRDFTTNFTNIRDEKVVTIRPDEKITYAITDGQGGNNQPTLKPGEKTTYLVGPGPQPTPTPVNPPNDDNVRVINPIPDDPMKPMASTPVAYAADLDEDEEVPCRKNVDGSVTVVRAYAVTD